MTEEERVWWSELADQYETWAYSPPHRYTCGILDEERKWGFRRSNKSVAEYMSRVWRDRYGLTEFPAGCFIARSPRRAEFCWYMAETIREAIGEA